MEADWYLVSDRMSLYLVPIDAFEGLQTALDDTVVILRRLKVDSQLRLRIPMDLMKKISALIPVGELWLQSMDECLKILHSYEVDDIFFPKPKE